jgi:hypothetical protein
MTTTTDETTELEAPSGEMHTRTRPGLPQEHMEAVPGSALDQVIAGESLYEAEPLTVGEILEAPGGDVDEPAADDTPRTPVHESLALRVGNLKTQVDAQETHVGELDRAHAERGAQLVAMARRMVDLEAYALAIAASVDFPLFDQWQADQVAERKALATPGEPVASGV